jgi:hypothetical protein
MAKNTWHVGQLMLLLLCPEMLFCLWLIAVSCTQRPAACWLLNVCPRISYASCLQAPCTALLCCRYHHFFSQHKQLQGLVLSSIAAILAVYMMTTPVRTFCRVCVAATGALCFVYCTEAALAGYSTLCLTVMVLRLCFFARCLKYGTCSSVLCLT